MRIVSLLPSATEILFGIGAGDEVVGVTHECDFPAEAAALPKLTAAAGPELTAPGEIDRHVRAAVHAGSSLYHLDSALLDELAPDLVVTQELCSVCAVSYEIVTSAAKQLRGRRTRVVSLEPSSLQDVLDTIAFLGAATDHAPEAARLIASLEERIAALRDRHHSFRLRTLLLEWTDPPMSAGHWIPEIIELAGGTPVLAHPGARSQRLEWAQIAAADPDAIVVAPCGFDYFAARRAIAELDAVPEWASLRAFHDQRVIAFDGNAYVSRPGPRLIDTAEILSLWYAGLAEYAG